MDDFLTIGYDSRINGLESSWEYNSEFVAKHMSAILDCGYVITQALWAHSNFYKSDPKVHNEAVSSSIK